MRNLGFASLEKKLFLTLYNNDSLNKMEGHGEFHFFSSINAVQMRTHLRNKANYIRVIFFQFEMTKKLRMRGKCNF